MSKLGEEGKVAVRNVRRDAMKAIEKLEKDGGISGARRTPGRGGAARGRGRERPRAAAGWLAPRLAGWLAGRGDQCGAAGSVA